MFLLTFPAWLLAGCDLIEGLTGPDVSETVTEAATKLRSGDLPGAAAKYTEASKLLPADYDAAVGASYVSMLQGDYDAADAYLAAMQPSAGEERVGEVLLRRAMVAMRAGEFLKAKQFAMDSGLDMGKLFAAEIALIDGEAEEAIALLRKVKEPDPKSLAKKYLAYLASDDEWLFMVAESQALWALGDHKVAIRNIEKPLANVDFDGRQEILLLWAGRAAVIREAEIAQRLLDMIDTLPESQVWRRDATQAIIHCASASVASCKQGLANLEALAPSAGLEDARVTAAQLIAEAYPEDAKEIVDGIETNSAARVLQSVGDLSGAKSASTGGAFENYLRDGG